MKLLIDIGNTSAKLAIADGDNLVHLEHCTTPWADVFSRLTSAYPLDQCVVSSVAGEDTTLISALQQAGLPTLLLGLNAPPSPNGQWSKCDLSKCKLHGVPQGYGADRLAADLGALAQAPGHTLLVIDAGTCITYDLISRDGTLFGGIISPGIQLRLKAMHEHTALLPLIKAQADTPLLGTDTKTALLSSAIHGTLFELEGYIRHIQADYPDLQVFLTGGNTFNLATDIRPFTHHDPHLLFRGLLSLIQP